MKTVAASAFCRGGGFEEGVISGPRMGSGMTGNGPRITDGVGVRRLPFRMFMGVAAPPGYRPPPARRCSVGRLAVEMWRWCERVRHPGPTMDTASGCGKTREG